jgi:hypothetical protein
MQDLLKMAGFTDIKIQVKENAAEIISSWMPGSGAEKYVTSAYITATKPVDGPAVRDNVRAQTTGNKAAPIVDVSSCSPGAVEAGC